jgi:hypothetical protein
MKHDIPTGTADLEGMTCIASVSSWAETKHVWTDLSIWYRRGHARPFITVIEGKVDLDGIGRSTAPMVPRFRAIATGTISRSVGVLGDSALRDELINAIPEGADELYPDSDTVRMLEADERRAQRGYQGKVTLTDALAWLYPDLAGGSDNQLAAKFEADFGIGSRTTRKIVAGERTGERAPTWVEAFVAALRFFDRKAWSLAQ